MGSDCQGKTCGKAALFDSAHNFFVVMFRMHGLKYLRFINVRFVMYDLNSFPPTSLDILMGSTGFGGFSWL